MRRPTISILTPPEPGAIAVLHIEAPDASALESAIRSTGTPVPSTGGVRVGLIAGVDQGVVIRWTPTTLHLMPHAGPAVVGEIIRRLQLQGCALVAPHELDPQSLFPEAADELEARMLSTLSRAASPLAIDLLLDQPRWWRAPQAAGDPTRDRILRRLLDPPTVVALGPPNIGKSTLCNAMAGRSVAVVADEAGTTRDHVGVLIDLDGLVVRYIDTPGMTAEGSRPGASADEAAAVRITRRVLEAADLVLRCGDPDTPPIDLPVGVAPVAGVVTVGLRADRGPLAFDHEVGVSAARGQGLAQLGATLRERLVPRAVLEAGTPWTFWET